MNKDGPVIVVNHDVNSQKMLFDVFDKLEYLNEIIFFYDPDKALDYLHKGTTSPFLILFEINPHSVERLLMDVKFQRNPALQSIPMLFFSRSFDQRLISHTYTSTNQGFFVIKNLD